MIKIVIIIENFVKWEIKKKFTYQNFITWLNEKLKGTLKLKSLKKEFVS